MASFVYTVWSITNVASMHCSVRPEISPCTCEPIFSSNVVNLSCVKVDSFHKIVNALSNKFESNVSISLLISHSQLEDMEMRSFNEMNLNIKKLRLLSDNLKSVPELPFRGISNVEYLSLAENDLEEVPKHVLNHLPKISTLDLAKGRIQYINHDDFKGVLKTRYLFLTSNNIVRMDKGSFPTGVFTLHLGRNQISSLNGTLHDLYDLQSLFINMNNLTTLDDELPPAQNLKLIMAQNNSLTSLPESFKNMPQLEYLFLQNNKLKSFGSILKNAKHIQQISAYNNEIEILAEDEFLEASEMTDINLSYNNLKSLNNSLLPLKKLEKASFAFNQMEEFSMNEILDLLYLSVLDISYNQIKKLTGRKENLIEPNSLLVELQLNHNLLRSLDGALMGLNKLRNLSLAHNQVERISPDDFIGLESLEILDLSHNQLLTLEETSTTYLPLLKILKVAYNNLTNLDKDFHGLPVLCHANFTNNQISSISVDLVSKTRCANHGVFGKLEIWLENNPIMCDPLITALCPLMENQEARIRGQSQCIESNQEVCSDQPTNNGYVHPTLVQVIVPSPLVAPKSIIKADYLQPLLSTKIINPIVMMTTSATSTTTSTTTTTTPTSIPTTKSTLTEELIVDEIIDESLPPEIPTIISSTPILLITETPAPILEKLATQLPLTTTVKEENTEYVVIDLVENLNEQHPLHELIDGELPHHSSEGDDNSVHEKFSPFILQQPENPQLLITPQEPPETP